MSTRRERKQYEILVSRILLFLLGISSVAFSIFWFAPETESKDFQNILGSFFAIFGFILCTLGLFSSDKTAVKAAERTGVDLILIVYVLIAGVLAWAIKKIKS